MDSENLYHFFDNIVCINLDISVERKKHAKYYFDKLNIPATFLSVSKHEKGGIYGCFDSHIKIIKHAYENNYNNILVFEDDFIPTPSYNNELLKECIDFMKNNEEWDIFYLGYSILKEDYKDSITTIFNSKYVSKNIVQFNPFFTHALCYNKRSIHKIMETYNDYINENVHYDMYLSSYIDLKNYCAIPILFDQNLQFEYNIPPIDFAERILRILFPLFSYTKIQYNIINIKYYINILYYKYNNLYYIIYFFILFYIKKLLFYNIKLNITNI